MYEMCLLLCRLKVAKGVIINKLFIKVNASDSSYMPERVSVSGCYTNTLDGRQHTLKETTIPSYDFTVLTLPIVSCWNCVVGCHLCPERKSNIIGTSSVYIWGLLQLVSGLFYLQLSSQQKVCGSDIHSIRHMHQSYMLFLIMQQSTR